MNLEEGGKSIAVIQSANRDVSFNEPRENAAETKKDSFKKQIYTQKANIQVMAQSRHASTSEERRNPFAEREGNALIWKNLNMTVVSAFVCICFLAVIIRNLRIILWKIYFCKALIYLFFS